MNIKILNKSYEVINDVDEYESFIWTERYNECGDFELVTNANLENYEIFSLGNYLEIDDSKYSMVIESVVTDSDPDNGLKMTVSGRSIESILDRRIIWKEYNIDGSGTRKVLLWEAVKQCFEKTLLPTSTVIEGDSSETKEARKISNFIFVKPANNNPVKEVELDEMIQLSLGDSVYDTVVSLCQEKHVGFKLIRNGTNLEFSLFCGVDRSFKQTANAFVIFSTEFDNIINSNFLHSIENYKNTALVSGEGNDSSKTKVVVSDDDALHSGLDRREVYITADKITQATSELNTYKKRLAAKGKELLTKVEYRETKSFEGEVENKNIFTYNKDYYIGDIVELKNEFGVSSHSRVTEFVISDSAEGYTCYPTFVDTEGEDNG